MDGNINNIEGVQIIPLKKIPDVRGTIMHGVRSDNILNPFGEVYFKKLYYGIINTWHIHKSLQLNYICVFGMIRIVMCDMRKNSNTFKLIQEVYIGDDNYALVHIPHGVASAMEGLISPFSIICNVASEPHDPSIKYRRIPITSKLIPFDWKKKSY